MPFACVHHPLFTCLIIVTGTATYRLYTCFQITFVLMDAQFRLLFFPGPDRPERLVDAILAQQGDNLPF